MLKSVMDGVAAVMKKCVDAATSWNQQQMQLASQLGITTEDASVLSVALRRLDISTDSYQQAASSMTRQLNGNEAGFNRLGVQTRNADGSLRSTTGIMADAITKLNSMKAGADRNITAMQLFGRTGANMGNLLKLNNEAMEEAAERAERLGLIVGGDAVAAQERFKNAQKDCLDTMHGMGVAIGQVLMPEITRLMEAFNTEASQNGLVEAVKSLISFIDEAQMRIRMLFSDVEVGFARVKYWASCDWAAEMLGIKAATPALDAYNKAKKDALVEQSRLQREFYEREFDRKGLTPEGKPKPKPPKKSNGNGDTLGGTLGGPSGTGADESRVAKWALELKQFQEHLAKTAEEQGRYHETTAAMERDYWQGILDTQRLSEQERAAVENCILDLDKAIRGERRREAEAGAAEQISIERDKQQRLAVMALAALDNERAAADHKVAMGQMTAEKRLEIERGFIEREREIRAKGGEDIALLDAELHNKLDENARRHREEQTRAWRELGASTKSSMEDAFAGLMNGTMSWGDATKAVMNTVLQGFIQMTAKELANFLSIENLKTMFKKKSVMEEQAIDEGAAVTKKATKVETAGTEITADAATGFAGAFSAIASIPYVGPFLAPAIAAAAMGAIMAMMGKLSSAAGGYWDVPHDQLAQIHKNEMVLPAAHSQRLRSMIEGGEGLQGEGEGGGGSTINVNINAADAKSVERLFRNNGRAMVRTLKNQMRDFAFLA
jgi:hypothetical protein